MWWGNSLCETCLLPISRVRRAVLHGLTLGLSAFFLGLTRQVQGWLPLAFAAKFWRGGCGGQKAWNIESVHFNKEGGPGHRDHSVTVGVKVGSNGALLSVGYRVGALVSTYSEHPDLKNLWRAPCDWGIYPRSANSQAATTGRNYMVGVWEIGRTVLSYRSLLEPSPVWGAGQSNASLAAACLLTIQINIRQHWRSHSTLRTQGQRWLVVPRLLMQEDGVILS